MPFEIAYTAWDTDSNALATGDASNHTITVRVNGSDVTSLTAVEEGNGKYHVELSDGQLPKGAAFSLRGQSTGDVVILGTAGVRPETMRGTDNANTQTPLDESDIRSAVGLANADLDDQLGGISDKTDQLGFTDGRVNVNLQRWLNAEPNALSGGNVRARDENGESLATAGQIDNLTNNTLSDLRVPKLIERPDDGTQTYKARLHLYDTNGDMLAPDSDPTVALESAAGTDRSGRLASTTGDEITTGVYEWVYTADDADALEQLLWTFTVVVDGNTRTLPASSLIVDTTAVDYTAADRQRDDAMASTVATNLDETVGSRLAASDYTAPDNDGIADAKDAAESVDGRLPPEPASEQHVNDARDAILGEGGTGPWTTGSGGGSGDTKNIEVEITDVKTGC